ncbi:MAG: archease [Candidatus Micrarchaeales archaeon]|jgi:SHS2 domain-containing protein|uniref:Archease domain-containing protein n=1 Tax=Candidatus Micrarchaeum acidiphilum ARMAN-2 TaxID=425595 RepID=C7DGM2_MICA2|nr:MAG: protein of unknown function DUF101 [Candidatus Micrarchaeum acidiphilum ARMAN-2]MCW6161225.1 archease [Candidatus Micrarchaeales archaeon]
MQPKKYQYLNHTADVSFIAYGSSTEELFSNSIDAMAGLMLNPPKPRKKGPKCIEFSFTESAQSLENLLWFVLQRLLSESDSRGMLPKQAKHVKIRKYGKDIRAECTVLLVEKTESDAFFDVKGVSPSSMKITSHGDSYSVEVILDV